MLGEERRKELLTLLKNSKQPITGTDLAKQANVSRQVIVNDMNLLKARNEPIIATSQGYLYLTTDEPSNTYERKIVCLHTTEQAEDEMSTIVDCGVTLKNVIVEHPLYGEITASMMISNRLEVQNFIQRVKDTKASLLSILTNGTHLHVISAPSIEQLDSAVQRLREKGYLVEE
ncbi:transcriptional regulator [Ureibacillus massiliensis 4400831 = CIP 108448 = CCUG 49529]|uniref:Transcriptional regulator n=1 Tax=Ureibacillus massiliensis 4400831 = CIP 108448 = CCUG 49529 TaxID=1211035 RepID=A0A0A3J3Z5_9BACL|nr:transcription repressor NadR [Ureibacillus massiliensis]KGR90420.1 transcriptional regulator [Ureibacillus massiliensis 4400831 = CIP 108448 = CCUG 49529]